MENPIDKAIKGTFADIDTYLGNVTPEEFRKDVFDLKARYANKEAIRDAVDMLNKLLAK